MRRSSPLLQEIRLGEALESMRSESAATGLLLKEVILPGGILPGFDVEWMGWTGNQTKYALEGYDGIRFIGQGMGLTHVVPSPGAWITCNIGQYAKRVEFQGITFHGARTRAIHQGVENVPANGGTLQPMTLVFEDCEIKADEPDEGPWVVTSGPGQTSTWGIFTYNAAVFLRRCKIDWRRGAEHPLYGHGIYPPGILLDEVEYVGSGGECVKLATRPGEAFWQPGTVLAQNSSFRDWGPQPWSWRGGGGVVVQGGGANVVVIDCRFHGGPGAAKSRAVMIDDGGAGRFYSALDGTPGKGPANGWVLIQDSLIVGDGTPSWALQARVGTLSPGAGILQARGYGIVGCALYARPGAETVKVEIGDVGGNVLLEGNNTPELRATADAITPVGDEAMVVGTAGTFPLSKGYRGGIFAPSP